MPTDRVAIEFHAINRATRGMRALDRDFDKTTRNFQAGFARIERAGLGAAAKIRLALSNAFKPSAGLLAGNSIASSLFGFGRGLGASTGTISLGGQNPFTSIIQMATSTVTKVSSAITQAISGVTTGIRKIVDVALGGLQGLVAFIPKVGMGLSSIVGVARNVVGAVGGVLQGLVGVAGGVFNAVVGIAGNALNSILSLFTKLVDGVAGIFGSLLDTIGGVFGKIARYATLGLSAALGVATYKSAGFRKEMARAFGLIAVDLENAGKDGAQAMRREFFQIARDVLADTPLRWSAVGKAIYDTISGGFRTAAEAKPILEAAAIATAAGGGDDPAQFVKALTKSLTQFEIPAARAREVADKFFQTVNYGVITVEQLAEILPGIGAVARSAGLDLESTLALIAEATKRLDLETASSGLQQFLLAVAAPDPQARSARKKHGIPVAQFSPAQQQRLDELEKVIAKTEGAIDAASRMEKKTHAQQLVVKDLRATLRDLKDELTEVQMAGDAVDFRTFLSALQQANLSAAQLKEVVGGRVQAFRVAAGLLGGRAAEGEHLKGEAPGVAGIKATEEEIRKRFAGASEKAAAEMKRTFSYNWRQAMSTVGLMWDSLMGRLEERAASSGMFDRIRDSFNGFRLSVEEWVASGQFDRFFDGMTTAAANAFGYVGDLLKGLTWDDFKAGATEAWNVVSTLSKAAWEGMKAASKIAGALMGEGVRTPLGEAFDWVQDKGRMMWEALVGLSEGDTGGFAAIFQRLKAFFLSVLGAVSKEVGKLIDHVLEAAAKAIEVLGGSASTVTRGIGYATGLLGGRFFGDKANKIDEATGRTASGIRSAKGFMGGFTDDTSRRAREAEEKANRLYEEFQKRQRRREEEDRAREKARQSMERLTATVDRTTATFYDTPHEWARIMNEIAAMPDPVKATPAAEGAKEAKKEVQDTAKATQKTSENTKRANELLERLAGLTAEGTDATRKQGDERKKADREPFRRTAFSSWGNTPGIGGSVFGTFASRPHMVEREEYSLPRSYRPGRSRREALTDHAIRQEMKRLLEEHGGRIPVPSGKDIDARSTHAFDRAGYERQRDKLLQEAMGARRAGGYQGTRSFVSPFSGAARRRMTGTDVRGHPIYEPLPTGEQLIPDHPGLGPSLGGVGALMGAAGGAEGTQAAKQLQDSIQAGQKALVDALKEAKAEVDKTGKAVLDTQGKLNAGVKELGQAYTGTLKNLDERLRELETTVADQKREAEGLRAMSENGAGV